MQRTQTSRHKSGKWHRWIPEIICLLIAAVVAYTGLSLAYKMYLQAAYPTEYNQLVQQQSALNGLPPSLVFAVIHTESGFYPNAQSGATARGLMQITEETFEWAQMRISETQTLDFDDLFDPVTNIRYGTAILSIHLEDFGSVELALCAYHAGAGDVQRWLNNPELSPNGDAVVKIPSAATRHYVSKVLNAQARYIQLYGIA